MQNQSQAEQLRKSARAMMIDIRFRLETVATIKDVEIINDSKATDITATHYSLDLMDRPVVWIAGANEMQQDFSMIEKLVKYKVKSIVCFGNAQYGLKFMSQMKPLVDSISWYDHLDVAMFKAWSLTRKGDVLLFSPACPGFDLFDDYRQRGAVFNKIVEQLK